MILARVGGLPVEEYLQPLAIAVLCSGAWLTSRRRRLPDTRPEEEAPSEGER
jgi:hypothetical protein